MRRRAKDNVADHPGFVFGIRTWSFDDFVNGSGVFGGDARGVEVELALFLGEGFAFEGDAFLFDRDALFVEF